VPTYDYQCRSCGNVTEVIHSMLEDGPTTCERCGGELRRVLYPSGIIFKGSGFYRTDSRASASSDGASSKATAESSDKSAAGTKATDAGSSGATKATETS
jgi:putative FmdB family regulatory protein